MPNRFQKKRSVAVRVQPGQPRRPLNIVKLPISYFINDPTTPNLVREVPLPNLSSLPAFLVTGYEGGGFNPSSVQGQAAGVVAHISNALTKMNLIAPKPVARWAAARQLLVLPRAGEDLNAFYDRRTLSFFYKLDKTNNQTTYACDSGDVVTHELGHAVLDSYRPDLWGVAYLEIWAFHEGFADCYALLCAMTYDELIQNALQETGGDLSKSNVISRLAEQMGKTAFDDYGPDASFADALRNAVNDFVYVDPSTIPDNAPVSQLSAEPHKFSRIITGAVYDCIVAIYKGELAKSGDPLRAAQTARNMIAIWMLAAIQKMPVQAKFFYGFSQQFIEAAKVSPYHDSVVAAFKKRNLLPLQAMSLEPAKIQQIRLCDHLLFAQSSHPASYWSITVSHTDDASLHAAHHTVRFIHDQGKVGDEKQPWRLKDGQLRRRLFYCGCGGACGPTKFQPEFFRPYKPQNSAGCGCKQKPKPEPAPVIRRGCYTRYIVKR